MRTAEEQGHEQKQQGNRQPRKDHDGSEHADRALHLPALPHNLDLPGMIGEENRRDNQPGNSEKAEEAAGHDRVLAFSGSSGALPGTAPGAEVGGADAGGADAGELPRRSVSSS